MENQKVQRRKKQQLLSSSDIRGSPTESVSRSKKANYFRLKPRIFFMLVGILIIGYIIIANNLTLSKLHSSALDSLASSFNLQKPFYVVVIDAGSTGTRLLAFTFHTSIFNGDLILDDEYFIDTKPGLSSYADNPKDGALSLEKLVTKAKNHIPKEEWPHTRISMKATAGLRLLPKSKADDILHECENYLKTSGFLVEKNSVSIMDGTSEGIYAWFTVNYLFGHLSLNNYHKTVAVLDLGGGSTQITYAVDNDDVKYLDKNSIQKINAFNANITVYTPSLLGMGLMAARKAILTSGIDNQLLESTNSNIIEIKSGCINPIVSFNWTYANYNFHIKGIVNESKDNKDNVKSNKDLPIVKIADCLKIVKNYIKVIPEKPAGLKKHEIYPVSYYFDRAIEIGLIDVFNGGIITINDFHKAAVATCNYPNVDQPFMCLDLVYIYSLLHYGFDLDPTTKLNIYKKYKGHELSWSLGFAFSLLNNDS